MAEFLSQIKFFKDRSVTTSELKEFVGVFKIEEGRPGDEIIKYGTQGEKFYIILIGQVEVMVPNPNIIGWRHQRAEF